MPAIVALLALASATVDKRLYDAPARLPAVVFRLVAGCDSNPCPAFVANVHDGESGEAFADRVSFNGGPGVFPASASPADHISILTPRLGAQAPS